MSGSGGDESEHNEPNGENDNRNRPTYGDVGHYPTEQTGRATVLRKPRPEETAMARIQGERKVVPSPFTFTDTSGRKRGRTDSLCRQVKRRRMKVNGNGGGGCPDNHGSGSYGGGGGLGGNRIGSSGTAGDSCTQSPRASSGDSGGGGQSSHASSSTSDQSSTRSDNMVQAEQKRNVDDCQICVSPMGQVARKMMAFCCQFKKNTKKKQPDTKKKQPDTEKEQSDTEKEQPLTPEFIETVFRTMSKGCKVHLSNYPRQQHVHQHDVHQQNAHLRSESKMLTVLKAFVAKELLEWDTLADLPFEVWVVTDAAILMVKVISEGIEPSCSDMTRRMAALYRGMSAGLPMKDNCRVVSILPKIKEYVERDEGLRSLVDLDRDSLYPCKELKEIGSKAGNGENNKTAVNRYAMPWDIRRSNILKTLGSGIAKALFTVLRGRIQMSILLEAGQKSPHEFPHRKQISADAKERDKRKSNDNVTVQDKLLAELREEVHAEEALPTELPAVTCTLCPWLDCLVLYNRSVRRNRSDKHVRDPNAKAHNFRNPNAKAYKEDLKSRSRGQRIRKRIGKCQHLVRFEKQRDKLERALQEFCRKRNEEEQVYLYAMIAAVVREVKDRFSPSRDSKEKTSLRTAVDYAFTTMSKGKNKRKADFEKANEDVKAVVSSEATYPNTWAPSRGAQKEKSKHCFVHAVMGALGALQRYQHLLLGFQFAVYVKKACEGFWTDKSVEFRSKAIVRDFTCGSFPCCITYTNDHYVCCEVQSCQCVGPCKQEHKSPTADRKDNNGGGAQDGNVNGISVTPGDSGTQISTTTSTSTGDGSTRPMQITTSPHTSTGSDDNGGPSSHGSSSSPGSSGSSSMAIDSTFSSTSPAPPTVVSPSGSDSRFSLDSADFDMRSLLMSSLGVTVKPHSPVAHGLDVQSSTQNEQTAKLDVAEWFLADRPVVRDSNGKQDRDFEGR